MGAFLDKPKTEKFNDSGTGNDLRFGLASMQGWRVEMEDAHCAYTNLDGAFKDWSFFAIFDGHAGAKVSAYCADELLKSIITCDEFLEHNSSDSQDTVSEQIRIGLRSGFLKIDEEMRKLPDVVSGEDKSGSTAVCVLISPNRMYFANCGDSRAMLVRDGGVAHTTLDHKPHNPSEKERIVNAGGSVMIQRVNGSLAVSRALGDYDYKKVSGKGPCEQLVSPEPEISIISRTHDKDEYIVLACDGVWDVMTNEDLCAFTHYQLTLTDDLAATSNLILDTCLNKGSKDNMSIVVVAFPGCPKVSPEAVEKNKILDAKIEQKVQELVAARAPTEDVDLAQIIQELSKENLENLPPGGLVTKETYIESLLHRYRPAD